MRAQSRLVDAVGGPDAVNRRDEAAILRSPPRGIVGDQHCVARLAAIPLQSARKHRQDRLCRFRPIHRTAHHDREVVIVPKDARASLRAMSRGERRACKNENELRKTNHGRFLKG